MKEGGLSVGNTTQHDRIHAAVLHELLFRRRPTLERLAAAGAVPVDAVNVSLAMLTARGACVADGSGVIVAAYPLSAVPTNHVVNLGWAAPWANCAMDALAVPAMVGGRGAILSTCALCGSPITIDVEESRISAADPASIVVAVGGLADCGDRPALETSCPYIAFFCGTADVQRWRPPSPWRGQFLPLDQAMQRALTSFDHVIAVYREYRPTM